VARALAPALATSAGVALVALPVRLLLPAGPGALLAIVVAGLVGFALGLLVAGRDTIRELREMVGEVARRKA
jgi:hypothetical protein